MKNEVKFCEHIGLFTINRPRTSCVHATDYCLKHCYCAKFEKLYARHMEGVGAREEAYWKSLDGVKLRKDLQLKRKPIGRIRLMSRGEAITSKREILRVRDLCQWNPWTLFMLPTKAWRNGALLGHMLTEFNGLENLRLLFSTDPDSFEDCVKVVTGSAHLLKRVSITYFGQDEDWSAHADAHLCPKTWYPKSGITCATCQDGCFREDIGKLKLIHFKKH